MGIMNEKNIKTVNIKVNDKNEIIAYAIIGGVNGINIPYENIPADFRENFDSKYYLYVDGKIKTNPDYVAPEINL